MKPYILTAGFFVLAACGNNSAEQSENVSQANGTIGMASEPAVPASEAGGGAARSGGSGVTYPDIAYGVAHYPNGRRVGVSPDYSLKEGKNPMWFQYETSDEPAEVLAFYKAEAKKAGYVVKSEKSREIWREISLKTARPGGGVMNVYTMGKKGEDILIGVHISEDG